MSPEEKNLIDSVFDRLEQAGSAPKDSEALALIKRRAEQLPDAAYGLVQAVLIQEMSLNQVQQHVADLERQLAAARSGQGSAGQTGGNPGFLAAAGSWFRGSVPNSGNPAPPAQPQPQPAFQAQPQYAQTPQYVPPPAAPSPWGQPAGGGFLRNAASMAAGVAGGALLAEGISSLFRPHWMGGMGGGFGGIGGMGSPWGGGMPVENVENVTVNNYGNDSGTQDSGYQDSDYQDSGVQDASFDDSSFDSGGSDDSSDI